MLTKNFICLQLKNVQFSFRYSVVYIVFTYNKFGNKKLLCEKDLSYLILLSKRNFL